MADGVDVSDKELQPDAELKQLRSLLGISLSLGLGVAGSILAFFFAGLALDRYLHSGRIALVISLLVGIAVSVYWAYHRISRILARFDTAQDEQTEPHD